MMVRKVEERLEEVRKRRETLEKELKGLPSGHVESKLVNGRTYYYLRYWEEGKLKSKYLGKDAKEHLAMLEKTNSMRREISVLREEEKRLEKVLERILDALGVEESK
ncbi:MAG: hypothetical protein RXS23_08455 [Metallosphaera yellowstonensis]|jgi:hypothetical protein|nr:hypothetical protein [Metallosphaera yellowstonensis]